MVNIKKLFLIESIMFLTLLLSSILLNVTIHYKFIYILFWLISSLVLYYSVGFEKEKSTSKIDIMQIIFIYSFIYLIFIYIMGFFIGFVKSPYSMNIVKITLNILPVVVLIVLQELIRYMVVVKSSKHIKNIIFLVIIFVTGDLIVGLNGFSVSSPVAIYEMIGLILIPSIAKHIFLTMIINEGTYKATILYRLIFDLNAFIIPIAPDLGLYLTSVFNILIPIYIYNRIKIGIDYKIPRFDEARPSVFRYIITTFIILLLSVMIVLVSGVFKYHAMAIGSGSMSPYIRMGDTVIIKKIAELEISELTKGSIIAFDQDNKIVVHRIVKIINNNGRYRFVTKGDNNAEIDDFVVESKDIHGKVVQNIRFVGWPSVVLGQLINK